ncbi:MAG: 16S rRNA (cytidine(1402)-2'-O)-methyltransferase [Pseudomonadota bacterium]
MDTGLYIVATPIGNLQDLSMRALEVLAHVDLIAAEDTRHTQRLLQHYGLASPVVAYHDHSDKRAIERLCEHLANKRSVAFVTDAGTPLISDPGYRLVRAVQDAGFATIPVPGPCAAIAALSVSGLPTDSFVFEGFLPAKSGARAKRLGELCDTAATMIFYESPRRVRETLEAMMAVFGAEREAAMARELTKAFETVKRASLQSLHTLVTADPNQRKGEIVLLISGARPSPTAISSDIATLLERLGRELPAKKAAAIVSEHTGLRKSVLYEFLLARKGL